jgi:hypothetical protein
MTSFDFEMGDITVIMKAQYVTPRLAVVLLTSEQEAAALLKVAQTRHQNYFHCFNLSTVSLGDK